MECVVFVIGILIFSLYWYWTSKLSYWKKQGVPSLPPHWFFGSIKDQVLRRKSWLDLALKCHKEFKETGYGGIYMLRKPTLVVCDPALVEKILVQDFAHFHDRLGCDLNEPIGKSLFHSTGNRWRRMRQKLNVSFSSKKVNSMFSQMIRCTDYVVSQIGQYVEDNHPVEIEPLAFEYSTEVIASCTFGVQLLADTLEGRRFKEVLDVVFSSSPFRMVRHVFRYLDPKFSNWLGIKIVEEEVNEYFAGLTSETIKYRQKNNIERDDFLQLLIMLREQEINYECVPTATRTKEDNETTEGLLGSSCELKDPSGINLFTEDTIASLMSNYLSAGINPSMVVISFALFEISRNPAIQKKLQEEVDAVISKHDDLSYENIRDLDYMDLVIQETLRLYTFNPFLFRSVTIPYKLPGTNIVLEKGLLVVIPIAAFHQDPHLYPSPGEFRPERFQGNNYKQTLSFMPFGYGPRICISIRFAVNVIKVCLARIISQFSLKLDGKTKLPLTFDRCAPFPKVDRGIWLTFQRRDKY